MQLTRARRIVLASLVGLLLLVLGPAHAAPGSSAPTGGLASGECTFASVAVSYSPQLQAHPSAVSLTATGTGDCLINGSRTTGGLSLSASSDPVGLGCGAGSATGSATLSLPGPYPVLTGVARVVNTGGLFTVTFAGGGTAVAGTFWEAETASCALAPRSTGTWTGALAF